MQDTVKKIIELIGGAGNISELDCCLTRVRIVVKDEQSICTKAAKDLEKNNNTPVIHGKNIHIIVGAKAGEYKQALEQALKSSQLSFTSDALALAGGAGNISELDNCLTRVRIIVKDKKLINTKMASSLEKQGFPLVIHDTNIHIIVGKMSEEYTKDIKKNLK